jgi:hypothetical protein
MVYSERFLDGYPQGLIPLLFSSTFFAEANRHPATIAREPMEPQASYGAVDRSIQMGPGEETHPVNFPAIGSGGTISCTRLSVGRDGVGYNPGTQTNG